jgi:transposase
MNQFQNAALNYGEEAQDSGQGKLRHYRRRWKVEQLFAWLGNFRRLVVRHEYTAENYLSMVHLVYIIVLLR